MSFQILCWSAHRARLTNNAAEADMARRGVHRLRMTCCRAVTTAVIRRAQMRAALQHFARNPYFGLARVIARILAAAARVDRDAAGLLGIGLVSGRIPVGRPFPDIADHVVDAVAVWRECGDRRGALVTVEFQILARKGTLPGVCHLLAAWCELVAPGELGTVEATAGGK